MRSQKTKQLLSADWLYITMLNFVNLDTLLMENGRTRQRKNKKQTRRVAKFMPKRWHNHNKSRRKRCCRYYWCSQLYQSRQNKATVFSTHRSRIRAILEMAGVSQLGERWLVSRFMKEIFHLRPPQPRYSETCDFHKVLFSLKSLGLNGSLSFK